MNDLRICGSLETLSLAESPTPVCLPHPMSTFGHPPLVLSGHNPTSVKETGARSSFDLVALLRSSGQQPSILHFDAGRLIFSAGDAADSIMYVLKGTVKLSVVSRLGREAVVAMFRAGDFFGETCLAGPPTRGSAATAMAESKIVVIARADMVQLLHAEPVLRDRFLEHMLFTNERLEANLVDQLVSSCEQRLARTLLLLARYGRRCKKPRKVFPMISQSTLAGMVGSTRSRINYFMKRFERLGFIETDGGLTVNRSLLRVTQETTHARRLHRRQP